MGAEDRIVGPQVSANPGRNGLFANVGVARAHDESGLISAGQLLLATPDLKHLAIKGQQLFFVELISLFGHLLDSSFPFHEITLLTDRIDVARRKIRGVRQVG